MNINRQSRTPIWDSLRQHLSAGYLPFHVPGHKGGVGCWPPFFDLLGPAVFRMDLTELPGLDDLQLPRGSILEAQILAAECFGAGRTYFLVNGATVGLHAALLSCTSPDDLVLVPRNAHRSVWAAMVLAGTRPVYLKPAWDPGWGVTLGVTVEELDHGLAEFPGVRAMVLLHPTYEGIVSDAASLVKLAHQAGVTVVADEAHGAHLTFHPQLPLSSLAAGADLVVQSTHKVLGAFTQAAMLHTHPEYTGRDVGRALNLLQSTSPSYLLLASLDAARCWMVQQGGSMLDKLITLAIEARKRINLLPGVCCLGEELQGRPGVAGYDPTRLVISFKDLGLSGYCLAEILREHYHIQVEMAGPQNVLLVLTVADTTESVEALLEALERVSREVAPESDTKRVSAFHMRAHELPRPEVVLSPRDAFHAATRTLPLRNALGKVAAEMFVPYPPGIPLVCPGERITREVFELMTEYKRLGAGYQGPVDPTLETVGVIDGVDEQFGQGKIHHC